MTRAERAAEKVRKAKEKLVELERQAKEERAEQLKAIAQAAATERTETRKAVDKRRYHVGALADEHGLFVWSNADLAAVFAVLGAHCLVPNPAAFLESFLCKNGEALDGVNGLLAEKTLSRLHNSPSDSAQSRSDMSPSVSKDF